MGIIDLEINILIWKNKEIGKSKFITDIGRTIAGITKNPKSTSFIFQAISMAVQRGNVQCVQGAYGELAFEELDEIFYIVKPNSIF